MGQTRCGRPRPILILPGRQIHAGGKVIMRLAHGVQRLRTVFRKGRHFHTGREFIMGCTRWGEVIIRIMPQPRQGRLLHGAILSQRLF